LLVFEIRALIKLSHTNLLLLSILTSRSVRPLKKSKMASILSRVDPVERHPLALRSEFIQCAHDAAIASFEVLHWDFQVEIFLILIADPMAFFYRLHKVVSLKNCGKKKQYLAAALDNMELLITKNRI
jgi:hypothetical protein